MKLKFYIHNNFVLHKVEKVKKILIMSRLVRFSSRPKILSRKMNTHQFNKNLISVATHFSEFRYLKYGHISLVVGEGLRKEEGDNFTKKNLF